MNTTKKTPISTPIFLRLQEDLRQARTKIDVLRIANAILPLEERPASIKEHFQKGDITRGEAKILLADYGEKF